MSFYAVAVATSAVGFLLGFGWLLAGTLVLKRWHVHANPEALLVGRRLGAAYVGIALMLALGRDAGPTELRQAACIGLLVVLAALAVLGLRELKAGRAGRGILVSVVIEALLAAGFASVLLTRS
jgi:hypothetical protein